MLNINACLVQVLSSSSSFQSRTMGNPTASSPINITSSSNSNSANQPVDEDWQDTYKSDTSESESRDSTTEKSENECEICKAKLDKQAVQEEKIKSLEGQVERMSQTLRLQVAQVASKNRDVRILLGQLKIMCMEKDVALSNAEYHQDVTRLLRSQLDSLWESFKDMKAIAMQNVCERFEPLKG